MPCATVFPLRALFLAQILWIALLKDLFNSEVDRACFKCPRLLLLSLCSHHVTFWCDFHYMAS